MADVTGPPAADRPDPPVGTPEPAPEQIPEQLPGRSSSAVAGWRVVILPLLALVVALAIGGVVMIVTNREAIRAWRSFFLSPTVALSLSWDVVSQAYYALFTGALGSPSRIVDAVGSGELEQIRAAFYPISETIVTSTPLIFVGLSVALGFRAGLFNIGAEGQMNVGAIVGAAVGIWWPGMPGAIHLILMVLACFVGGMLWGAIPGFLKAKTGAHEVITTIMLNFVAVSLTLWVLSIAPFKQQAEPIAKPVSVAFPHLFGANLRVHTGIFMALGFAWLVAWMLKRTTIGFEFQAVGSNPDASRVAGMRPARTIVVVMALAGGLSGLAAASQLGGVTPSLLPGFASGLGFTAIALALVGRGTPLGVVLAAFLFAILQVGGRTMQVVTDTPIDITTVIQGLVIMFIAAPTLVAAIFRIRARRGAGPQTFAKGWAG